MLAVFRHCQGEPGKGPTVLALLWAFQNQEAAAPAIRMGAAMLKPCVEWAAGPQQGQTVWGRRCRLAPCPGKKKA